MLPDIRPIRSIYLAKPIQGSLVSNNPLDFVCQDLTKVNPNQEGTENILVITDTFLRQAVPIVTPSQKPWSKVHRYQAPLAL